jgi:hypothetical protein
MTRRCVAHRIGFLTGVSKGQVLGPAGDETNLSIMAVAHCQGSFTPVEGNAAVPYNLMAVAYASSEIKIMDLNDRWNVLLVCPLYCSELVLKYFYF